VSGEPAVETAATRLRRRNLLSQGKPIQDYVVIPNQKWLDGIATTTGKVRQFFAMPTGSGYSVEAQVTAEEVTGDIQFEVTPRVRREFEITIFPRASANFALDVNQSDTIDDVKSRIHGRTEIPPNEQIVVAAGKRLDGHGHRTLHSYALTQVRSSFPKLARAI
jgi:hypothetical protein